MDPTTEMIRKMAEEILLARAKFLAAEREMETQDGEGPCGCNQHRGRLDLNGESA